MKKLVVFGTVIVLASGGSALYASLKSKDVATQATKPVQAPRQASRPTSAVTLYFDNYGFDQNDLKLPVGTAVTVKNIATTGPLDFEALSYQPDQNTDLDLGTINPGDAKSFTIRRSGMWQYQGNGNPQFRGVIATAAKSSYDPSLTPNAKITAHTINIVYDDYGFMPNEVTVPVGTTITLRNGTDDTQPGVSHFAERQSDVHKNPALDLGIFQKQQVKTFTLTTKGSWELENIDQPTEKALMRITTQ